MWSDPVLDLLPNALLEVNPLGDVTQANASACVLLGAGEALVGRNLFEVLHRQVPEDELLTDTGRGPHRIDIEGSSFRVQVVHHSERTVVVLNEALESADGIGELNEEGLDQVVRVLGRLVSGLAHQVNNPLAIMMGAIDLILATEDEDSVLWKRMKILQENGERIASLIQSLQVLSDPRSPGRTEIVLDEVVDLAIGMAGRRLDRVRVIVVPCAAPVMVRATQIQLVHALVYLLCNAASASSPGRDIVVRIVPRNQWVRLTVEHVGPSMSEAELQEYRRPLEQDFPTAQPGRWLGIALCWAIARRHEGHLWAENHQGEGAAVHLELPADL